MEDREWVVGNIFFFFPSQYCPVSFQRLAQSITFSTVIRWREEAFLVGLCNSPHCHLGVQLPGFQWKGNVSMCGAFVSVDSE